MSLKEVISSRVYFNCNYKFQSEKAETMICLPGFTVSPAEEVKSRLFAFKVYHDGTSFYFAADSYMEFSYWLDAITVSTLAQSSHSRGILLCNFNFIVELLNGKT